MILYYAVGGGLGHLSRATAVIHTLGLEVQEVLILTSVKSAIEIPFFQEYRIEVLPAHFQQAREAYETWLRDCLQKYAIAEIFIDAFPGGLIGEWHFLAEPSFRELRLVYVARLLQWEKYLPFVSKELFFRETLLLEPLEEAHYQYIELQSFLVRAPQLQYPEAKSVKLPRLPAEAWLIVHSGPPHEVQALCHLAQETARLEDLKPSFVLISLEKNSKISDKVQYLPFYPAHLLFAQAARIFTACGFNAMYQTRPFAAKHHFLPFERHYDDQFLRAQQRYVL